MRICITMYNIECVSICIYSYICKELACLALIFQLHSSISEPSIVLECNFDRLCATKTQCGSTFV